MNFQKLIKENVPLLIIISAIYFLYATLFLKPWEFKYFSLVDDGQVLIQSSSYLEDCLSHLKCSKFLDQTFEFGTSRFRPVYWLINNALYELFGNNAQLHHVFRVYIVGYVSVLLLSLILLDLGVSWLLVFTGALMLATNISFSENVIRLGTNEPYQLIFLALFSFFYLRSGQKGTGRFLEFPAFFLLILGLGLKENSIAVLPVVLLYSFVKQERKSFVKLLFASARLTFLFVLGMVGTSLLPSNISIEIPVYTSNYTFQPLTIFDNSVANVRLLLNSLSPFIKIVIFVLPLLFLNRKAVKTLKSDKFYYWVFFAGFFTLILFPWRYVLDRYQLIAIFGIIIVIAFLLDRVGNIVKTYVLSVKRPPSVYHRLFDITLFVIVMTLFNRGFPVNLAKTINYQGWFSAFTKFEADQVSAIAKYNDRGVLINGKNNIGNWEFLYEVPIHLRFLYGYKPNVHTLEYLNDSKEYIFSRSPFDSVVKVEDLEKAGYKIVDSKSYYVKQIDPILFSSKFVGHPISSVITPTFVPDGISYYWEIRQKKAR